MVDPVRKFWDSFASLSELREAFEAEREKRAEVERERDESDDMLRAFCRYPDDATRNGMVLSADSILREHAELAKAPRS